jgi:hypothetical protein
MEIAMNRIVRDMSFKSALAGVALCALIAGGAPSLAHATVISGSSSAFDDSVNLVVTPGLVVSSGPVVAVSGTAPPLYNTSNFALSASVLGGFITTNIITANANSNVDGSAGSKSAAGTVTINNFSLGGLLSFGGITATTLQSTATSSGDFGALTSTGSTTISGLVINGLAMAVVMPTANDVLFDAGGVEVIANAQTTVGDGVSSTGITVDALEVVLTDVAGTVDGVTGLISGDVIIDQSRSALSAVAGGGGGGGGGSAVPEPSSFLVLAAGLLGLAGLYRKRLRGDFA